MSLADDLAQGEDCGRVGADRERTLERRQLEHSDAELVGDVLHRLLAFGEHAGDHEHSVSPPLLLAGELEHVQRCAAYVQSRDHVHDREPLAAHAVSAPSGCAATTPNVSQKTAVTGAPPKSAAPASAPAVAPSQPPGT